MGDLNGIAGSKGTQHTLKQPVGSTHQADRCRIVGTQLSHHGRINELHHHGRDIGQDGGQAQGKRELQLLARRQWLVFTDEP